LGVTDSSILSGWKQCSSHIAPWLPAILEKLGIAGGLSPGWEAGMLD